MVSHAAKETYKWMSGQEVVLATQLLSNGNTALFVVLCFVVTNMYTLVASSVQCLCVLQLVWAVPKVEVCSLL